MKKIIKAAFRSVGLDVHTRNNRKSKAEDLYLVTSKDGIDYFETPIGNYFLPNDAPGDIVIKAMKQGLYFDENIINIAKRYIKPNTSVLDVGANFGQMSILFSELVGERGKVYSFDADDYIFELFKLTIKANKRQNINPVFGAVFNLDGKIFYFPKQDFKKFSAYGSYGLDLNTNTGREVKSITIDSLNIPDPISFMKVDIQGSDLFALKGAKQTILKNKMPIIFEFEQQFQQDFSTSFQDYVEFVAEIGYRFSEVVDDINYLLLPK